MDNATLIAGIYFVALRIIIMSLCIIHCREFLLLVGIWDNVLVIYTIVGNADLIVLHSAVAIISALVIEIGSKITNVM